MNATVGRVRLVIAAILTLVAMLFSLIGWMDAVEGGAAIILAGILTLSGWLVGRVKPPALTWAAYAVSIALDIAFYTAFAILAPAPDEPMTGTAQATTVVASLNLVYTFSSYFATAGAVWYFIRVAGALRRGAN